MYLCSPLFGRHLCFHNSASALHSSFCGSTSGGCTSTPCPHPALSCAHDTNALGLAALAVSALSAGLTPMVSSARAGAVPTSNSAPPYSYALTHEGSTPPTSAFLSTPGSPKGSGFSGNAGELPSTDGTPPASCRPLPCASGGFEGLGWGRSSMAHCSVAAPSPCGEFSHVRVSSDGMGGKGDNEKC